LDPISTTIGACAWGEQEAMHERLMVRSAAYAVDRSAQAPHANDGKPVQIKNYSDGVETT
jgi:hypothetical protein